MNWRELLKTSTGAVISLAWRSKPSESSPASALPESKSNKQKTSTDPKFRRLAAGHNTYWRFSPSKFHKIIKWAQRAEKVVAQLCPTGDIEKDYYSMGAVKKRPDVRVPSPDTYVGLFAH